MRKWYLPGRKQTRRKRGIVRDARMPHKVTGLKSAWSKKADAHRKRLFKPIRLEGMWAWRDVALSLHAAGIPVHSGTQPVERFWSCLKAMLPPAARHISLRWFNVLASLCFLRYNYQHYTTGALPVWMRKDSLLATRIESFTLLSRALHADTAGSAGDHLRPLFAAFQ